MFPNLNMNVNFNPNPGVTLFSANANNPLSGTFTQALPDQNTPASPVFEPQTGNLQANINNLLQTISLMLSGSPSAGIINGANQFAGGIQQAPPQATLSAGATNRQQPSRVGQPAGNASGGKPVIAQIDNFTPDDTGFNHGAEVGQELSKNGATVERFDISGQGDSAQKISSALDQVIQKVKSGQQIDAVNLSQQDFENGQNEAAVRNKIEQLSALGVPVAVAAGNNGPNQTNQLTTASSFNVASKTNGVVNADSGVGNVQAEGRTTSFATANLTTQLAAQHANGLSAQQMFNQLA